MHDEKTQPDVFFQEFFHRFRRFLFRKIQEFFHEFSEIGEIFENCKIQEFFLEFFHYEKTLESENKKKRSVGNCSFKTFQAKKH